MSLLVKWKYGLSRSRKFRLPPMNHRGKMIRPPFAPGYSGVALRLDGPDSHAYAMLPNFQAATEGKLTVVAWVRAESRHRWASIAKNWSTEGCGQFHFGLLDNEGDLEIRVHDINQLPDSGTAGSTSWQSFTNRYQPSKFESFIRVIQTECRLPILDY